MSPTKCKPKSKVQKLANFGKLDITGRPLWNPILKDEQPLNIKFLNLKDVNNKR